MFCVCATVPLLKCLQYTVLHVEHFYTSHDARAWLVNKNEPRQAQGRSCAPRLSAPLGDDKGGCFNRTSIPKEGRKHRTKSTANS